METASSSDLILSLSKGEVGRSPRCDPIVADRLLLIALNHELPMRGAVFAAVRTLASSRFLACRANARALIEKMGSGGAG